MRVRWGIGLLATAVACASTTITVSNDPIVITGSYSGTQEGSDGGVTFENDPLAMALVQDGDSIHGTWEASLGGMGTLAGTILPSDSSFEFTLVLTQTTPCAGTFNGKAEARVGTSGTGAQSVGILGDYAGSDCDSDINAAFFVRRGG